MSISLAIIAMPFILHSVFNYSIGDKRFDDKLVTFRLL